jgi:tetratricopeptide (TPR) repeat protein
MSALSWLTDRCAPRRSLRAVSSPKIRSTRLHHDAPTGVYQAAGRADNAIAIYEQLLPIRERVLGAEHPDTLSTRSNLALAYQAAGRAGNAIAIYEQLLPICERVLGAEHPDTLSTRSNLALAYQDAGPTENATRLDPGA